MELLVKLCLLVSVALANINEDCKQSAYEFENYLATKTPYRIVANKSFDKIEFEGCTPLKTWMVIRHGTRNPSHTYLIQYNKRLPQIRDLILEAVQGPNDFIHNRDLDLFKKWRSKVDEDDDKKLRGEGEQEMLLLAERMQSRFPEVFDKVYSNTSYKFKYTHSQRTRKSAYYFTTGLFGKHTAKDVWYPTPLKGDPILRFYKLCNKWRSDIKKQSIVEREKFRKSEHFTNVIHAINRRVNLQSHLTLDDVDTMYMACAFETAWNHHARSPWCSLFSIEDLKVLEYYEDLKYYWVDGYGHKLTYDQACPIFNDMISFITSKDKYPKVIAYFTHSGTLLKFLAHLGLYNDEKPLLANEFLLNDNRKWRASKIDCFATNLAFTSYNCQGIQKLLTMHQENIIRLPACPDSDLCDLDKIKQHYLKSINECNFDAMCSL